jgi:archaellum component FlaC
MPIAEERLASLEARMDRINDLIAMVADLRADMNRRFDAVDRKFEAIDRKFEAIDRKFEAVDGKIESVRSDAHREFRWVVGIQLTTMAAVIAALISAFAR